jgi:hypothetical protein
LTAHPKEVILVNKLGSCRVYVLHPQHVIENSSLCTVYKSCVSPGFAEQVMPVLLTLCYNGSLVIWTVVSLIVTDSYLKLKLKLISDRRSVGQSVLVSGSHQEPMTRFFFSVWRLRVSWSVAPSLTRGWVCNLLVQLFLVLARAVTLGSKSCRTHDHILLSHERPQPGGPGPHIYIPQEQGGPVITPGTGFPFVASYDSQGCGWGILTRLHTGRLLLSLSPL